MTDDNDVRRSGCTSSGRLCSAAVVVGLLAAAAVRAQSVTEDPAQPFESANPSVQEPTPAPVSSYPQPMPVPVLHLVPIAREAPAEVLAAIAALRSACWAWPRVSSGEVAPLVTIGNDSPDRIACDMAANPEWYRQSSMWVGGFAGMMLTVVLMIAAGLLRMILLPIWLWRPQPRPAAPLAVPTRH